MPSLIRNRIPLMLFRMARRSFGKTLGLVRFEGRRPFTIIRYFEKVTIRKSGF